MIMKKHLSVLILLTSLLVPWAMHAQTGTTISTFPWSCNFENASQLSAWHFSNGSNGWYVGTATNNGGTHAMYVSENNGTSSTYSGSACVSYAYVTVSVDSGLYAMTFDWKCNGESTYDFLRVAAAPSTTALPTSYSSWTSTAVPTGFIALDGGTKLNLQSNWQSYTAVISVPAAGTYNIIFVWRNDGSLYYMPPAAIDNVMITQLTCPQPTDVIANATTTEATITWRPGGTETAWELVVDGTDTYYPTDTTWTLTGLTSNTPYSVAVRAICGSGDSSFFTTMSFRTACVPISTLPYSNGFEDDPYYLSGTTTYAEAFPACWTRINDATGTSNYYPYIATTAGYVHSGTKGMYWYQSTTSGYAQNEYAVLPQIDLDAITMSDLTLAFYARTTSTSYHPTPVVGVMTNPADTTTFTPVYTFTSSEITTDWQLFVVSLASYTGTGAYIAIKWANPGSTWYMGIDDIFLTDQWCDIPHNVAATSTTDEVTITWSPNGGSSFTVVLGQDTVTGITDTSYTFMNLTPNTGYDYAVATECVSNESMYIVGNIRTQCTAISTLPYSNSFEDDPYYLSGTTTYAEAFPHCWTRINDATGTYNYYPYITTATGYVHSGTKGMYWYQSTTSGYAQNEYAVLPQIDLDVFDMSDLTLAFYARTTSTSYHPAPVVGVMTDPTDVSTFTPVYTFTATEVTTNWELFTVSFANYTGTGAYIAIKWANPGSAWYLAIDDIYLTDDWCNAVETASASSTPQSVTLTWEPNGGSNFTIIFNGDTVSGITDTTYTINGLTANTNYNYSIYVVCPTSTSMPYNGSVRTQCTALDTLPYTQDFEGAATGSSTGNTFVDCMTRLNNGTQYFGYPYVSSTSSYNHTPGGTKGLYWYNCSTAGTYGDYQIVVLPGVDTTIYPLAGLQLRFWARPSSTSYSPQFQVGVMTDPSDPATFQQVSAVNVRNVTDWQEFTVVFSNFTGSGEYVAIRALRPSSSWYAYVDDITLEPIPTCPAITGLDLQTTLSNALLTWGYTEGYTAPTSYEVSYTPISPAGATVTTTVTDNYIAITGLDTNTTYKVVVRADCGGGDYGRADSVTFAIVNAPAVELDGGTGTSYYLPIGNYFNYSYTQQLITASEMGDAPCTITGIDFQYAYSSASTSKNNVSIYLANTATSSLSSAFVPYDTSFHLVYTGNLNCTQGWNHFEFDSTFSYDGTSNLLIVVHDNSGAYNGSSYTFSTHTASGKGRYVQNDSNPYTISSPGTGTGVNYRVNMKICYASTGDVACVRPVAAVTNTTASTVDLVWAPGYNETSWDLDYRQVNSSTWINEAVGITSTSYTFTGLDDVTEYEFRVSFVCSDNGNTYETVVNAVTACIPKTLPYTENFDSYTTSSTAATGVSVPCWDAIMTGTSTYQTGSYLPQIYYSTTYAHSGSYSYRLYGVGYHMLPEVTVPLDSLRLSFWDYTTNASYGLIVGVMEGNNFIPIDTIVSPTSTKTQHDVLFSNYHGNSRTIAFCNYHTTSSTTYYSYHYIDDIFVDYIPSCPNVTSASAVTTASAARITWEFDDYLGFAPDGYEVNYRYTADSLGTPTTVTTVNPTLDLIGLDPDTGYSMTISALCGGVPGTPYPFQFRTKALPCAEWDTTNGGPSDTIIVGVPGTSTTDVMPLNQSYNYSYCQFIILASEVDFDGPATITGIGFDYSGTANMTHATTCSLYVANTTRNSMATGDPFVPSSALQLVYVGPLNCSTPGWNYFQFNQSNLAYDGVSNLVVAIVDNSGSSDGSSATFRYQQISGTALTHRVYGSTPYDTVEMDAATANASFWRSNMRLLVGGGTCISQASCYAPAVTAVIDTNDVIQIEWIPGYQETSWNLDYKAESATGWTSLLSGTTATSFSMPIDTLDANTQYTFRVTANCTDTALYGEASVTTPCARMSVPFAENFDTWSSTTSDPLPACWEKHTNYTTNYPYASTSYHHSGTKAMYMYSTNSTYSYMVLPLFNAPIDSLMVSFWLYKSSTTYTHELKVGVMTDPANVNTFTEVASVAPTTVSTWEPFEVPLSSYTGSGQYIAIMSPNNVYSYPYLDDLEVNYISSCPRVTNVEVHGITYTDATITWDTTAASDYEVQYGPAGFAIGTGTSEYVFMADSVVITGLAASTYYDVYVRGLCTSDTGVWSYVTTFRTQCGNATLPYHENFDSYTTSTASATGIQANCWDAILTGTSTYQTGSYVPQVYRSTSYSHSGNYSYRLYGVGYHMLPPMPTSLDSLQLNFWDYTTSTSYGLEVGVMEGNNFVPIQTINSPSSTHVQYEVGFDTYTGTSRIIAFRNYYNTSTSTYYSYHYLDDVHVDYLPSCPRVTQINASSAGSTLLTVDWNDRATASSWQVEYGAVGHTFGTGTIITVTSHPVNITGLDTATSYDFYVRPICSVGDTGDWSSVATLATAVCDNGSVVSTGTPTSTSYYTPINNYYNYTLTETIIDSAELAGMSTIEAIAYDYAYSSPSTLKTNVTIWLQPTTKTVFTDDEDMVPLNASTAVQVYSGSLNCSQGWNYFQFTAPYTWDGHSNLLVIVDDNSGDYDGSSYVFNNSSCTGYKTIQFYSDYDNPSPTSPSTFPGNTGYYQYRATMQLISCSGPSCPAPALASVTNTYNTATITVSGGISYELSYGTNPAALANTVTSNTGVFNLTGLTPNAQYYFEVVQLCDSGMVSDPTAGTFTTDDLPCFTPEDLAVAATTFNSAVLNWTSAGSATTWVVELNGAGVQRFDTVTTNPYIAQGLFTNQQYTASVRAICLLGTVESDWSDTITFTTDACTPVQGVTVNEVTNNSATVHWMANSGVMGYKISYGDSNFYDYEATVVDVPAATTSYTMTGLEEESAYEVYVQTKCAEGVFSVVTAADRVSFRTTAGGSEGIYDAESGTLTLFPNPASTSVTVTVSGMDGEVTVEIVDLNGRTSGKWTVDSGKVELDLSGLSQGAYFVRVTGERQTAVRKLIIR